MFGAGPFEDELFDDVPFHVEPFNDEAGPLEDKLLEDEPFENGPFNAISSGCRINCERPSRSTNLIRLKLTFSEVNLVELRGTFLLASAAVELIVVLAVVLSDCVVRFVR